MPAIETETAQHRQAEFRHRREQERDAQERSRRYHTHRRNEPFSSDLSSDRDSPQKRPSTDYGYRQTSLSKTRRYDQSALTDTRSTHRGESSREYRQSPRPTESRETRPFVRPPPTTEPIPLHKIVISSALKRPPSPRIQDRLSRVQPSTSQSMQQQPSTSSRMFPSAPAHMNIRPESVIVTPSSDFSSTDQRTRNNPPISPALSP